MPKMSQIHRTNTCESPSHIVKCSKTSEAAYVLSRKTMSYSKYTWKNNTEDDTEKIDEVNNKLPDCEEITKRITGKMAKRLVHIFLCDSIVSFEDETLLEMPDAIFLQRVSAQTKTFDMVCFYGKEHKIISIVAKSDLDVIREWYPNKIYSCGADPLPMESVSKYLKDCDEKNMYERLFKELTDEPESSCSEYEVSSSESDEDYVSDSDDEIEEESEEDVDEYEVTSEDEDYEVPRKKIKV